VSISHLPRFDSFSFGSSANSLIFLLTFFFLPVWWREFVCFSIDCEILKRRRRVSKRTTRGGDELGGGGKEGNL
jgi:hypothetical protein